MLPGRTAVPVGLSAGVLGANLLFFFGIPVAWLAVPLLGLAGVRGSALAGAAAIGLAWSEQALDSRWQERLDPSLAGARLAVTGRVAGLPERFDDGTRFRFRPDTADAGPPLPRELLVYWYREPPPLSSGERWRLRVRVRPPWGEVNFQGADRERWYFAEGLGGVALVESGERLAGPTDSAPWHSWRQHVRDRLAELLGDGRQRGMIQALAIGDRSRLADADRATLVATGTAHLLAISGLHVGLAAVWGFWLARLALLFVPVRRGGGRAYPVCALAGLLVAAAYASLAGFATSTVRALVMLAVAVLALATRRVVPAAHAWLLALAVVLVLDPVAPLRTGFWLSFAAVAVLLMLFGPRPGTHRRRGWAGAVRRLALAQAGIALALLPLGAWWFQRTSPVGLLANPIAIPWVGFAVVPAMLFGLVLLPFGDLLARPVLMFAGHAAQGLLAVLGHLTALPAAQLDLPQPGLPAVLLASLGAAALLLPRGVPLRRLGAVLMLPMLFRPAVPPADRMRLDVLDTGQGSALLLTTARRLLLYDAGPGDGRGFDRVGPVIVPAISQAGFAAPDRIVVSHADLDHAGGLPRLHSRFPDVPVFASLPSARPGIAACDDRLAWHWDATEFVALHPGPWLPYLGNDASCVLSVRHGGQSVLLTGDISQAVEQRLIDAGLRHHDVLLVPHHGSASSSSAALLQAVAPRVAVVTAGPGNRFGFPRPEVRARYRTAGIPLWSTGDCGALRLELGADGTLSALSARRVRAAPWRWPAGPDCP